MNNNLNDDGNATRQAAQQQQQPSPAEAIKTLL